MATKVSLAFGSLLHKIQPTDKEVTNARLRGSMIRARLQKNFNIKAVLNIGSHARGTAIRASSDLDILALFSREEARWGNGYKSSLTFIDTIRDDLRERFPLTEVRRDQQAVVVNFGGGSMPVDVVPAIFWGMTRDNWPLYYIPDGEGGWTATAPGRHSKYLTDQDKICGGKLKKTVQLLKYWRDCREQRTPVLSFHLELLLASNDICRGVRGYGKCLFDAFYLLAQRQCRGLQDPLGISGVIYASKTESQRAKAISAVEYSRDHAWAALQAEDRNDLREAFRQWEIVFNGRFPRI